MQQPTILTPEWRKKKKEMADKLMEKGKMFFERERWKHKRKGE